MLDLLYTRQSKKSINAYILKKYNIIRDVEVRVDCIKSNDFIINVPCHQDIYNGSLDFTIYLLPTNKKDVYFITEVLKC